MSNRSNRPAGPFEHVGLAIKILRTRGNLTQGELAERAGITKSQVSHYETQHQRPHLDTLDAILLALGVDALTLVAALGEAEDAAAQLGEVAEAREKKGPDARAACRRTRRELALQFERYLERVEESLRSGKD